MEERRNNAAVEESRLKEKLKTDRARNSGGRISAFGLVWKKLKPTSAYDPVC